MSHHADLAIHEWRSKDADADAPVAVLVHGVTGWHRTWWRVGPALAERGWRVIAVDQRGHGRSPRLAGPATIDDLADDLEAVIERHASPPIDLLVGHSLGAVVSMRLALRRPGIARRLVLEDPPSIDRASDEEFFASIRDGVRAARDIPETEVARELAENPRWLEGTHARTSRVAPWPMRTGSSPRFAARAPSPSWMRRPIWRSPLSSSWPTPERSVLVGPARERLRASLPAFGRIREFDSGHTIHRDRFDELLGAVLEWAPER